MFPEISRNMMDDKMLDHTTIENLKVCHQQYS